MNRVGIKHQKADELSTLEGTGDDERELGEDIPVLLLETTREATCCVCETFDGLSAVNLRMTLVLDIAGD